MASLRRRQQDVDRVGEGPRRVRGETPAPRLWSPSSSAKGGLQSPVHVHEKTELAFLGAHLGDVDVEVTEQVALEGLLGCLVALDLGQPADAVPLEAAVQGRAGELRDQTPRSGTSPVEKLRGQSDVGVSEACCLQGAGTKGRIVKLKARGACNLSSVG